MGSRGPAPKPTSSRDRDLRRKMAGTVTVSADGELRGFRLPEDVGIDWHMQTIKWWNTWRNSPLSQTWLDTDWDFLLDTALMHSSMWTHGNWTMAAEVRQRVGKLGATLEDRQRLKISVETGPVKETPGASVMDDYRKAIA